MRTVLATLAAFLFLLDSAQADYVEVRRAAKIYAEPDTSSAELASPAVGTNLALVTPGQTNGYYHVRVPAGSTGDGSEGYIYRTRVRGFPGDPPDAAPALSTAVRSIVYKGIPTNAFTEFPIKVLDKGHYVVGYSEDFLNPAWVFYHIGPAVDFRSFPRPGFRVDQDTTSRVKTQDYSNSGYDRGHMAPNFALGSRFGAEGAKSTFVMSNVTPQNHEFNDGQWGDLEEWIAGRKPPGASPDNFIRGWADQNGEVWVVVGPLFEEDRDPLSAGVPVPSSFFCIVVDEEGGQPRALAFIMPHEEVRVDELAGFLTTIDEIETRAGLDFFHELPDSVENPLERSEATELWPLPVAPN
jgi:endonuclease G